MFPLAKKMKKRKRSQWMDLTARKTCVNNLIWVNVLRMLFKNYKHEVCSTQIHFLNVPLLLVLKSLQVHFGRIGRNCKVGTTRLPWLQRARDLGGGSVLPHLQNGVHLRKGIGLHWVLCSCRRQRGGYSCKCLDSLDHFLVWFFKLRLIFLIF